MLFFHIYKSKLLKIKYNFIVAIKPNYDLGSIKEYELLM